MAQGFAYRRRGSVTTLLLSSLVSVVLYILGAVFNHGSGLYFLIWNLFLAWIPLGLAWLLVTYLRGHLWSSWRGLGLTLLWLIFLPNCFYLLSDFLHLYDNLDANVTYNIALLASFAFNGMLLGYLSLGLVHRQLLARKHGLSVSWRLIGLVLAVSSYAIYLGRYIRLNSWDIFTNFSAVLVSISDQIFHPERYVLIIGITFSFFVLLMTIYIVMTRISSDIIKSDEK